MLDRADCADFGCHNSIRLETEHFLNTLALTFISFSRHFVFAMQKHYLFFCERSSSLILVLARVSWLNLQSLPVQALFRPPVMLFHPGEMRSSRMPPSLLRLPVWGRIPSLFKLPVQVLMYCLLIPVMCRTDPDQW